MSGATARIPQRETKHIKQLDTVLKYRLGIVPDEKITVYTGAPKPMALVKGLEVSTKPGAIQLAIDTLYKIPLRSVDF